MRARPAGVATVLLALAAPVTAAAAPATRPGDAYFVGPGHTPVLYAGTEVVEFSPTEELGRTMEVVTKNMEEMDSASS